MSQYNAADLKVSGFLKILIGIHQLIRMKRGFIVFGIGVIVLLVFLSFFDYAEIISVLQTARLSYVLLAALLQIAIILTLAIRLKIIARKYKGLSFLEAVKITTVGMFLNLVTPISKIGGQPAMAYIISKRNKVAESSSIVVMDTMIEIIVSFTVIILFVLLFWSKIPGEVLSVFILFILIMAFLTAVSMRIFLDARIMQRIIMFFAKRIRKFSHFHGGNYGKMFSDSFGLIFENKPIMAMSAAATSAVKIMEFARIWLIFASLNIFLPFHALVAIWSMMLILSLVPWLPGSLGLLEFGSTSAVMLFGISAGMAVSAILLDRLVSYWFVIVLCYAVIWMFGYNIKKMRK